MTGKAWREDGDLTLLLAWESLITDVGQSRAGGVCQQYLISISLTATAEITLKNSTVSLYPAYKPDRISNSSCYVSENRHIFLWKDTMDCIKTMIIF